MCHTCSNARNATKVHPGFDIDKIMQVEKRAFVIAGVATGLGVKTKVQDDVRHA